MTNLVHNLAGRHWCCIGSMLVTAAPAGMWTTQFRMPNLATSAAAARKSWTVNNCGKPSMMQVSNPVLWPKLIVNRSCWCASSGLKQTLSNSHGFRHFRNFFSTLYMEKELHHEYTQAWICPAARAPGLCRWRDFCDCELSYTLNMKQNRWTWTSEATVFQRSCINYK